jgi:hypothetical protein
MRVSFVLDRSGYPQARSGKPWVALGSMLESDLQGDLSIRHTLVDLRRALAAGSHIEITGNAHTIAVEGNKATVVCDHDPSMPASRIATEDLIALVLAWQSFRAHGAPDHWPSETPVKPSVAQPPQ